MRAHVHHHDVAVLNLPAQIVVVQRRRVWPGADDRSVGFGFRAAHRVHLHHFRGHLIFPKPGTHHFERGKVRVERKINGLAEKRNLRRPFDQPQIDDVAANVLQICPGRGQLQPLHRFAFVGKSAQLFFVGKNRVERRIELGEPFNRRPHFRKRPNVGKAGARLNARIAGRHAHAIPLFLGGILRGEKQDFARPLKVVLLGFTVGGRQQDQPGFLFVVAGEVVKILLLRENIRLGIFFAAVQAGEDDRRVRRGGKFGTALGVDGVGLAFAPLLCVSRGRQGQGSQRQKNHRAATRLQKQPAEAHTRIQQTTHPVTSDPQGKRASHKIVAEERRGKQRDPAASCRVQR